MARVVIKFESDKMANAFQIWFCEMSGYAEYADYAEKMQVKVAQDVEGEFGEDTLGRADHEINVSRPDNEDDEDNEDNEDD